MNLMDEKFAKSVFISACGFAVGCISTSAAFTWAAYNRAKKQPSIVQKLVFTEEDAEISFENAKTVMENSLMPTLLSAQQAGWSPEVFENNVKTQFDMMTNIMVSLYHDGQNENLTYEEFEKKIKSEIEFIIMSARDREL